jgi:hypothetical protein
VREHEVYAISSNSANLRRTVPVPAPRQTMRLPTLSMPPFLKVNPRHWPEVLAVNSKLFVVAPLAFTLIVGTGVIARSHRNDDEAKPAPVAPPPRAALAKVEPAPSIPAPVLAPPVPQPKAEEAKVVHRPKEITPKTAAAVPAAKPSDARREPDTVATLAPAQRDAAVSIIALPWAEVFIDGARQGVSPPLKVIPLKPGKHKVELRNGSFPPHVQTVDLRPGTEISITHRFRR